MPKLESSKVCDLGLLSSLCAGVAMGQAVGNVELEL